VLPAQSVTYSRGSYVCRYLQPLLPAPVATRSPEWTFPSPGVALREGNCPETLLYRRIRVCSSQHWREWNNTAFKPLKVVERPVLELLQVITRKG